MARLTASDTRTIRDLLTNAAIREHDTSHDSDYSDEDRAAARIEAARLEGILVKLQTR